MKIFFVLLCVDAIYASGLRLAIRAGVEGLSRAGDMAGRLITNLVGPGEYQAKAIADEVLLHRKSIQKAYLTPVVSRSLNSVTGQRFQRFNPDMGQPKP